MVGCSRSWRSGVRKRGRTWTVKVLQVSLYIMTRVSGGRSRKVSLPGRAEGAEVAMVGSSRAVETRYIGGGVISQLVNMAYARGCC